MIASSKFCVVNRTYSCAWPSASMWACMLPASRPDHSMRLVTSTPTRLNPSDAVRPRSRYSSRSFSSDHPGY
ncbi:hypothetical protein ACU686_33560 [Yinghuangia aomiensis]